MPISTSTATADTLRLSVTPAGVRHEAWIDPDALEPTGTQPSTRVAASAAWITVIGRRSRWFQCDSSQRGFISEEAVGVTGRPGELNDHLGVPVIVN